MSDSVQDKKISVGEKPRFFSERTDSASVRKKAGFVLHIEISDNI